MASYQEKCGVLWQNDECKLCHLSLPSIHSWLQHKELVSHLQKVKVKRFLESSLFEAAEKQSDITVLLKSAKLPFLGKECIYEFHDIIGGFSFWICTICYCACDKLASITDHLMLTSHRITYMWRFYPENMALAGSVTDLDLDSFAHEIKGEHINSLPKIHFLRLGVTESKAMLEFEQPSGDDLSQITRPLSEGSNEDEKDKIESPQLDDLPSILPQPSDSPVLVPSPVPLPNPQQDLSTPLLIKATKGVKNMNLLREGETYIVWCETCWQLLVFPNNGPTFDVFWMMHTATQIHEENKRKRALMPDIESKRDSFVPHLERTVKLDTRRPLNDNEFITNGWIHNITENQYRYAHKRTAGPLRQVGMEHIFERYTDSEDCLLPQQKDFICELCAQVLSADINVQEHIMTENHLMQFMHKEEPVQALELLKKEDSAYSRREEIKKWLENHKPFPDTKVMVYNKSLNRLHKALLIHNKDDNEVEPSDLGDKEWSKSMAETYDLYQKRNIILTVALNSGYEHFSDFPIKKTIDECKEPLIGLQYVVEIFHFVRSYFCRLCFAICPGVTNEFEGIMAHLLSYQHRKKYLENNLESNKVFAKQLLQQPVFSTTIFAKFVENQEKRQPINKRLVFDAECAQQLIDCFPHLADSTPTKTESLNICGPVQEVQQLPADFEEALIEGQRRSGVTLSEQDMHNLRQIAIQLGPSHWDALLQTANDSTIVEPYNSPEQPKTVEVSMSVQIQPAEVSSLVQVQSAELSIPAQVQSTQWPMPVQVQHAEWPMPAQVQPVEWPQVQSGAAELSMPVQVQHAEWPMPAQVQSMEWPMPVQVQTADLSMPAQVQPMGWPQVQSAGAELLMPAQVQHAEWPMPVQVQSAGAELLMPAQVQHAEWPMPVQVQSAGAELSMTAQVQPVEWPMPVQVQSPVAELSMPAQVQHAERPMPVQVQPAELLMPVQVHPIDWSIPFQVQPADVAMAVQIQPAEVSMHVQSQHAEAFTPVQIEPAVVSMPVQIHHEHEKTVIEGSSMSVDYPSVYERSKMADVCKPVEIQPPTEKLKTVEKPKEAEIQPDEKLENVEEAKSVDNLLVDAVRELSQGEKIGTEDILKLKELASQLSAIDFDAWLQCGMEVPLEPDTSKQKQSDGIAESYISRCATIESEKLHGIGAFVSQLRGESAVDDKSAEPKGSQVEIHKGIEGIGPFVSKLRTKKDETKAAINLPPSTSEPKGSLNEIDMEIASSDSDVEVIYEEKGNKQSHGGKPEKHSQVANMMKCSNDDKSENTLRILDWTKIFNLRQKILSKILNSVPEPLHSDEIATAQNMLDTSPLLPGVDRVHEVCSSDFPKCQWVSYVCSLCRTFWVSTGVVLEHLQSPQHEHVCKLWKIKPIDNKIKCRYQYRVDPADLEIIWPNFKRIPIALHSGPSNDNIHLNVSTPIVASDHKTGSANDGKTSKSTNDGKTVEKSNDGKSTKSSSDGKTLKSSEDGKTLKSSEDGKTLKSSEDGKTLKSSEDGKTLKSSEDGKTLKSSDGSKTLKNSGNGKRQKELKQSTRKKILSKILDSVPEPLSSGEVAPAQEMLDPSPLLPGVDYIYEVRSCDFPKCSWVSYVCSLCRTFWGSTFVLLAHLQSPQHEQVCKMRKIKPIDNKIKCRYQYRVNPTDLEIIWPNFKRINLCSFNSNLPSIPPSNNTKHLGASSTPIVESDHSKIGSAANDGKTMKNPGDGKTRLLRKKILENIHNSVADPFSPDETAEAQKLLNTNCPLCLV